LLIVDGIVFSLQHVGGISVYFMELLSRLSNMGVPTQVNVFDAAAASRMKGIGLPVVRSRARVFERYRKCRLTTQATVFHSSYYRLPTTRNVPVVTTVYDFTYERLVSGPRRWLHSSQKFAAIRRSNAIICISEATLHDLVEFVPDVNPERIKVIHLAASNAFAPIPGLASDRFKRPCILFVGTRDGYKSYSKVVEAAARLSNVDLVIVGGGSLRQQEDEQLHRLLPGRHRHVGNVTSAELNILYNTALCLVYPSLYEGFGLPVVEAMRAGCPVIAVGNSAIREIAADAALLVPAPEPDLLHDAIVKLLDPGEHKAFRDRGILRARIFNWEKTFGQTIDVYENLLGHSLRLRHQ